jgi:hypothetical protein
VFNTKNDRDTISWNNDDDGDNDDVHVKEQRNYGLLEYWNRLKIMEGKRYN